MDASPIPACVDCGLCCTGTSTDPITVPFDDDALERPALQPWLAVRGTQLCMKTAPSGACAALEGTPGQRVGCAVYLDRPAVCHTYARGSLSCRAELWAWRQGQHHAASAPG